MPFYVISCDRTAAASMGESACEYTEDLFFGGGLRLLELLPELEEEESDLDRDPEAEDEPKYDDDPEEAGGDGDFAPFAAALAFAITAPFPCPPSIGCLALPLALSVSPCSV
jgi:hypothetical protein